MADMDLNARFPDMRPIKSAPTLSTINGIGTTVMGCRDRDPQTGTYVTTQYFTFFFIPVLALRAFRVADAQGRGWYFLGREPLSFLARLWNIVVVGGGCSLVGLIFLTSYFNSPEYKAHSKLEQARLAAAENPAKAARDYRDVIQGNTKYAAEATSELQKLVQATLAQGTLAQCSDVLAVALALVHAKQGIFDSQSLVDDTVQAAQRFEAEDPRAVLTLVSNVAEVAPQPESLIALRQSLLEKTVTKHPDDVEAASSLAVIYESQKKPQLCRKLLEPLAGKLGTSEGARVLGQIYADSETPEKSLALLTPYATQRLKKLHEAEKNFEETYKTKFDQTIRRMEKGDAPGFSMERYDRAGKVEQQAMVSSYVEGRLKNDPDLARARDQIVAQGAVVPVALDLGVVLLHRGQRQTDDAARKRDLQQAEEMFLAVRGQAGENDMFRLYLGQVYYWLGKHADGRKLFDELLAAHKRQGEIPLAVANTLRDVGAVSDARALAEELYRKESDKNKKFQAAKLRALTFKDLDDKIMWMKLCDLSEQDNKATLEYALGVKDISIGKDDAGIAHLRSAIAIYEALPETSATLNNGALVWLSLAGNTGDPDDFKKAATRLERAYALSRSDSILLSNTAEALTTAAIGDALRDKIDLRVIKTTGDYQMLPYVYKNAVERQQLVERLKNNADMRRALEYFERAMLLAPRNPKGYIQAYYFHALSRDVPAMRAIAARLGKVDLDLDDQQEQTQKHLRGERDAELKSAYSKSIERGRKTLIAARAKGGATQAVAAGQLAEALQHATIVGVAANLDEVVSLAEEANQAAPSVGASSCLRSALLKRAATQLVASDAEFAAMLKRTARTLEPEDVLAAALQKPGPLRDKILAHADVRRSQQLLLQLLKDFPDFSSGWHWAMLQASHPEEAKQIANALRHDEQQAIQAEVIAKFSPLSASTAMRQHWKHLAQGDQAAADAALAPCRKAGIPLP